MTAAVVESCQALDTHLEPVPGLTFRPDTEEQEMHLVQIYRDIEEQQLDGFGGAFSQSAAQVFGQMDPQGQNRLLELLFSKEGLAYTCGRIPIGACDFSDGNYAYCETKGAPFDRSALEREPMLPLVRGARRYCPELELAAAPWSPPAWMKTNGEMCHGGRLRPEVRGEYARYLTQYVKNARELGLPITLLSVQNEPKAVQTWESCIYNAEEEGRFIRDFLAPELKKAGLEDVGILLWDHNKERVFTRTREILEMENMPDLIRGVAFHWYSGDHFENLALCRRFYPQLQLVFTEGCVELRATNTTVAEKAERLGRSQDTVKGPWGFGELYAHDIVGNLNGGMSRYLDWNLLLDVKGGPNHVENYCSAPILCNPETGEIHLQPSYDYIAHFSRFLPRGSRRVAVSRYTSDIETVAAKTPQGELVLIAMNAGERSIPMTVSDVNRGMVADWVLRPHSIITAKWPL